MNKLSKIRNGTIFLVIALCFLEKFITTEAAYIPTTLPDKSFKTEGLDSNRTKDVENLNDKLLEKLRTTSQLKHSPNDLKKFDANKNGDKDFSENVNVFNPFMPFPFFPFPFPDLKRSIFRLNSTESTINVEKDGKLTGNLSSPKPKPFFFIDFAFNIREIPLRNRSNVSKFSKKDSMGKTYLEKPLFEESDKKMSREKDQKRDITFNILNDDWSFFDDSPLFPSDVEEFLPKSDFLFFDFPFHRKQNKKLSRHKRDSTKPLVKKDLNFVMDFFDEAISRAKKEMERPLWDLVKNAGKSIRVGDKIDDAYFLDKYQDLDEKKLLAKDIDKHRSDKRGTKGTKRSAFESTRHKNPVILGKVVEIGEIHFSDDYSKSKKKRRNVSVLGNKGNQETSIELSQLDEPLNSDSAKKHNEKEKLLDGSPKDRSQNERAPERLEEVTVPKDVRLLKLPDVKKNELMTKLDRRPLEKKENIKMQPKEYLKEIKIQKSEGSSREITKVRAPIPKEEGFKNVGHTPGFRKPVEDDAGPEVFTSESSESFERKRRQEIERISKIESVTPTKEEVIKNITHVLGQFFSMITKFGDSKSDYRGSENTESHFTWTELDEHEEQEQLLKDTRKRLRRDENHPDDVELKERKTQHVADLNYLFLTVTLPTMFAFTLLLMVCFFNLQVRGWLCTKLFKPRNVYVVEEETNKLQTSKENIDRVEKVPDEEMEEKKEVQVVVKRATNERTT